MADAVMDIDLARFLIAYASILVLILFIRVRISGIAKDMLKAVVRMSLQLAVAALLLEALFAETRWYYIVAILAAIYIIATKMIHDRLHTKTAYTYKNIFVSLAIGSSVIMFFYLIVVVGEDPWYDPRYVFPIGTMIVGNSMNSCAIAVERFLSTVSKEKMKIQTLLSYGATPIEATSSLLNEAFKASFLPVVLTMNAMGIVVLPGMMSGQILAGTSPLVAIKYQIAIMFAIVTSEVLVSYIVLFMTRKELFNEMDQLQFKFK